MSHVTYCMQCITQHRQSGIPRYRFTKIAFLPEENVLTEAIKDMSTCTGYYWHHSACWEPSPSHPPCPSPSPWPRGWWWCHWPVGDVPGHISPSCSGCSLGTFVGSHRHPRTAYTPDRQTGYNTWNSPAVTWTIHPTDWSLCDCLGEGILVAVYMLFINHNNSLLTVNILR